MKRVFVAGVGMTKFDKPGKPDPNYPELAQQAGTAALADAGISYADIEQACVGYVHADSTAGQRAVYGLGMTGIPVLNVNNNCASGSSALYYARQLVAGGLADCVLALGFEKMRRGSLGTAVHPQATDPVGKFVKAAAQLREPTGAPVVLEMFRAAGLDHMERYGTTREQFAKVAEKNHRHSAANPNAQFQDVYSLEEILSANLVCDPLTKLQCSPTSDGSAAAIVVSEEFVDRHGLADQAIEIVAQALTTDTPDAYDNAFNLVGKGVSEQAARQAYAQAELGPTDVDVIELHDCFSINEILSYEALGLCAEGEGATLIDAGATTYGGKWVVNPSGGLISKGHPLGATGLAQCAELSWQLRGEADRRQVEGARVGLAHNVGLGSAAVVTIYRKAAA
ncbi:acetyl-CoA acetyltransferase [Tamaricihabitans halophyticus]|uniref:propanoyl-CoA C-acyltransferase n=1 Tax=Tamaricihabitans halophyticus TaxID=1262583 RepID=A0A4R2QGX7_9PSEU|nr:lipid-transfer protein [Tamaricihabitans halophyticus]TCP48490.1 acetyl-CoA acetyltransferase [Tamaricihabitans halophyticus]